ncbi:MAG: GDP-mannose dehydrogenase, partial [Pseudomonadota bacterium]
MTEPRIAYVGMTHLGLNSAVAAADKGFPTLCFDPDPALIDRLKAGNLPVVEPDLPELVAKNATRLSYSSNSDDLADCDVVYVAPDVPTDDKGQSDLSGLDRLIDQAAAAIRPDAVLVVLSQVPPGFTRQRLRDGLILYYQVETLVFGRAMERALYPERYIVGCADPEQPLPDAFRAYLEAYGCPILPMRFESAELTKIAINCCLVSSISVANTLSELCEGIGAVWSEIAPALKLDRRIGQYSYLTPGLGIAGGNLERDLATVIRMSEAVGSDADVVRAWVTNS